MRAALALDENLPLTSVRQRSTVAFRLSGVGCLRPAAERNRMAARALHRQPPVLALVTSTLLLLALSAASDARAHQTVNGVWTYRYYTRADDSDASANCNAGSLPGAVDPLNIIAYRWGEGVRMHSHFRRDTNYGNTIVGSPQVTCITTNGTEYTTNPMFNQATNATIQNRAHFRSFTAGHEHADHEFKWSVYDVHHEGGFTHDPNDDWESWEVDLAAQMHPEHEVYYDFYERVAPGLWRGFWDSGTVTRIGGLHNGRYP